MFTPNRRMTLVIGFLCLSLLLVWHFTTTPPVVEAQSVPFLAPPYYGTKTLNALFDHEYPTRYTNMEPKDKVGVVNRNGFTFTTGDCSIYTGHAGIDYGINYDYVLAAHSGTVEKAGWSDTANRRSGLGLHVEIQLDGSTYQTRYGHLSTLMVQKDQLIAQGSVIAISGNSGFSTGPHLHFELRKGQTEGGWVVPYPVNPYGWESTNPARPEDPWENAENGRPASINLWQTLPSITAAKCSYESGDPLPPSNDPPLEPNLTHPYRLVIDDLDDGFAKLGGPWTEETCNGQPECYGSTYQFIPSNHGFATWTPHSYELLAAQYDVYAYIPNAHADTVLAHYRIFHNNKEHSAAIDQSQFNTVAYPRTWAYLGRYDFGTNTNQTQRIFIFHDGDLNQDMAADAVVFVLVDGPPDINVPITQGSDDAGRSPGSCGFGLGSSEIYLGHCNSGTAIVSGFRYSNVDIPAYAPITRAHLLFTVDGPYDEELDLRFYGDLDSASPTFSSGDRPEDRPLTVASLPWYIPTSDVWVWSPYAPPNHRYSPNLAPIVQEIVNLSGWQQGNSALTFIVKPAPGFSSNEYRRVMAYERGPVGTLPARLLVWYSCPGGPPCPQQ